MSKNLGISGWLAEVPQIGTRTFYPASPPIAPAPGPNLPWVVVIGKGVVVAHRRPFPSAFGPLTAEPECCRADRVAGRQPPSHGIGLTAAASGRPSSVAMTETAATAD
jgi:hypothetical protein